MSYALGNSPHLLEREWVASGAALSHSFSDRSAPHVDRVPWARRASPAIRKNRKRALPILEAKVRGLQRSAPPVVTFRPLVTCRGFARAGCRPSAATPVGSLAAGSELVPQMQRAHFRAA